MRYAWQIAALVLWMTAITAQAQDVGAELFKPLGGSLQPKSTAGPTVKAVLVPADKPGVVTLEVQVVLPEGANSYSQDLGFAKPTKITLTDSAGWTPLDPAFTTDHPPKRAYDEQFAKEVEKFTGTVVFSRRYWAPQGVEIETATLSGRIDLLVCLDVCTPHKVPFKAEFSKLSLVATEGNAHGTESTVLIPAVGIPLISAPPPAVATKPEPSATYSYELVPKRGRTGAGKADPIKLKFDLSPPDANAGEMVTLSITMEIPKGWSTYALEKADETQIELPTVIAITPTNLKAVGPIVAVPEPTVHTTQLLGKINRSNAHEGVVTWKQQFAVNGGGPYGAEGTIKYQICEVNRTCLPPNRVSFALGSLSKTSPVPSSSGTNVPPNVELPATPTSSNTETGLFTVANSGKITSLRVALLFAFLGGVILNIMPCVLPVLAIKILSLVQQAGERQGRIVVLNLAYTVGVVSVFLVLATLAVTLQLGWGGQFQNETFRVVMVLVVFAMGLSLLGVFELPIPGLIPSAHHHSEGVLGAFNTGIIATLLATPCTGPFMVPVFTFALTQPKPVIFLIFGVMGLGMASPYVLAGFFPALVNWLPRPGMWMVRFKQFSGFIILGTVLWLMSSIDMSLRLPVLVMLLAEALGLWMLGNLHDSTASREVRWRVRIAAILITLPLFLVGLQMYRETAEQGRQGLATPGDKKLPWTPFSESTFVELRKQGKPMLIDFTADWCQNCKFNEVTALNTQPVIQFVREQQFVPLLADFTDENEEIRKWLNHFSGSNAVPLTVIVPPGKGDVITLTGIYTQSHLLAKLKAAVEHSDPTSAGAVESGTAAPAAGENLGGHVGMSP